VAARARIGAGAVDDRRSADAQHKERPMATSLSTRLEPSYRTIDGLQIRFVASER